VKSLASVVEGLLSNHGKIEINLAYSVLARGATGDAYCEEMSL
jgi:hypothetical protein